MPRINRKLPKLTPQDLKRFQSRIDQSAGHGPKGDCWIWTGEHVTKSQYGLMTIGEQRKLLTHRLAYFIAHSVDPGNLLVCHNCDNPPCVNPNHLFLGTHADNNEDMRKKGRQITPERMSAILQVSAARGNRNGSHTHPERTVRGEAHPGARMTANEVRQIRSRYAAGGITLKQLAAEFGRSVYPVHCAIRRRTWKHID